MQDTSPNDRKMKIWRIGLDLQWASHRKILSQRLGVALLVGVFWTCEWNFKHETCLAFLEILVLKSKHVCIYSEHVPSLVNCFCFGWIVHCNDMISNDIHFSWLSEMDLWYSSLNFLGYFWISIKRVNSLWCHLAAVPCWISQATSAGWALHSWNTRGSCYLPAGGTKTFAWLASDSTRGALGTDV